MRIRAAIAPDAPALRDIRRRAILALADSFAPRAEVEAWATRGAADKFAHAIRDHEVWLAVDDAVVGWVEIDGDTVASLYVDPTHGQRGVGSALLGYAELKIREAGHAQVRLEASPNARPFYLHRGYRGPDEPAADGSYPLLKEFDRAETDADT